MVLLLAYRHTSMNIRRSCRSDVWCLEHRHLLPPGGVHDPFLGSSIISQSTLFAFTRFESHNYISCQGLPIQVAPQPIKELLNIKEWKLLTAIIQEGKGNPSNTSHIHNRSMYLHLLVQIRTTLFGWYYPRQLLLQPFDSDDGRYMYTIITFYQVF